jgi:hypothetical protein
MPQENVFSLKPRFRLEAGRQTVLGQIQAIDHPRPDYPFYPTW